MIAYVDSSVLLRKLLGEPRALSEWNAIEEAYASRIVLIEVGRVIDRLRLDGRIDDRAVAHLHEQAKGALRSIEILALTEAVLERAAASMPTVVGTLDAVHLATAVELVRSGIGSLVFATHDAQLARAARALGLEVRGA